MKEEFDYFPTVRPNTNLAQIAQLLVIQLDAQAQPALDQHTEL